MFNLGNFMRKTALDLKVGDIVYQERIYDDYISILTIKEKTQVNENTFQFVCEDIENKDNRYTLFGEASHQGFCGGILYSLDADRTFCTYINASDIIENMQGKIGFLNNMIQKVKTYV